MESSAACGVARSVVRYACITWRSILLEEAAPRASLMEGVQGDDGWVDMDEKTPHCGIGIGMRWVYDICIFKTRYKIIQQEFNTARLTQPTSRLPEILQNSYHLTNVSRRCT